MIHRFIFVFFLATTLFFALLCCAPVDKVRKSPEEPLEVRLETDFLKRALEYERQGEPHKALQAYEAALAVILAKKKGLETSLRSAAQEHYQKGLELQRQGKSSKARHEFLVALRLWPDFPEVVRLLRPAQTQPDPATRYLVHKVKKGESLSALAQRYYNDQGKYAIIAQFNKLEDPTKLYAGMELRIPEIEGVKFADLQSTETLRVAAHEKTVAGGERKLTETEQQPDSSKVEPQQGGIPEGERNALPEMAALETDYYQIEVYQEQGVSLLEAGEYLAALHEFQKVLNIDPNSEKVRDYMVWAHYRHGESLFQKGEYLEARQHFKEALRLDPSCSSCREYLTLSAETYKEHHYLRGIEFFEEEELEQAIAEWQLVKELDPDYKLVQDYLLRAEKLKDKVIQLKEKP
jgi:tetratricopeptide (TPR) repeat protein